MSECKALGITQTILSNSKFCPVVYTINNLFNRYRISFLPDSIHVMIGILFICRYLSYWCARFSCEIWASLIIYIYKIEILCCQIIINCRMSFNRFPMFIRTINSSPTQELIPRTSKCIGGLNVNSLVNRHFKHIGIIPNRILFYYFIFIKV